MQRSFRFGDRNEQINLKLQAESLSGEYKVFYSSAQSFNNVQYTDTQLSHNSKCHEKSSLSIAVDNEILVERLFRPSVCSSQRVGTPH